MFSETDTLRRGTLAIRETTCSTSSTPMATAPAFAAAFMRASAPASSMTSMALSGRKRSLMNLPDSSAAALSTSSA